MLENINSSFFVRLLLSILKENNKLNLIKHNKSLQKKVDINILNYKLFSGRYIIYESKEKGKECRIENDIIIYKGEYLKDKRNGKGKEYNDFGDLIFEGEYLNGKRTGKGKEYYPNGNIKFKGVYLNNAQWSGKGFDPFKNELYQIKNGKGTYQLYYNFNLILKEKGAIINGKRKEYNKEGELIFEGEYQNGVRNGKGKEYDDKGELIFEGEYLNEKRFNGKEYDNDNDNIYEYKRGIVFKKEFYDNGNLKFDGMYIDGKRYGNGKEYHTNGKLKFEGEYYNGYKLKGKLYYPEGNLKFEGEYLFN